MSEATVEHLPFQSCILLNHYEENIVMEKIYEAMKKMGGRDHLMEPSAAATVVG